MKRSLLLRACAVPVAALFSFAAFAAESSSSLLEQAAELYRLGQLHTKEKRIDEAVSAFEKATRLDATRAEYFSDYAIALSTRLQSANFMMQAALAPKMRKAFAKSVELDPNHLPGLIGLARYYSNAPEIAGGSLTKAKEYAERIRALQPFTGELELGHIAERAEDLPAALGHFEAASKLQSRSATAQAAAGRMLTKLGRNKEARERLEKALELDPKRDSVRKALAALGAKE